MRHRDCPTNQFCYCCELLIESSLCHQSCCWFQGRNQRHGQRQKGRRLWVAVTFAPTKPEGFDLEDCMWCEFMPHWLSIPEGAGGPREPHGGPKTRKESFMGY